MAAILPAHAGSPPGSGVPSPANRASTPNHLTFYALSDFFTARGTSTWFEEEVNAPGSWLNNALWVTLNDAEDAGPFNSKQCAALAVMALGPGADLRSILQWLVDKIPYYNRAMLRDPIALLLEGSEVTMARNRCTVMLKYVMNDLEQSTRSIEGDFVPYSYDGHLSLDPLKRQAWKDKVKQDRSNVEQDKDQIFPDDNCCGFSGPEADYIYSLPKGREDIIFSSFYRTAITQPSSPSGGWNKLPMEMKEKIVHRVVVFGDLDITYGPPPAVSTSETRGFDPFFAERDSSLDTQEWIFQASVKVPSCFVPKGHQQHAPRQDLAPCRLDRWEIKLHEVLSLRAVDKTFNSLVMKLFYGQNHFSVHDVHVYQTDSRPWFEPRAISERWLRLMQRSGAFHHIRDISLTSYDPVSACIDRTLSVLRTFPGLRRVVLHQDPGRFSSAHPIAPKDIPGLELLATFAHQELKVYIPVNREAQRWVQARIDANRS